MIYDLTIAASCGEETSKHWGVKLKTTAKESRFLKSTVPLHVRTLSFVNGIIQRTYCRFQSV